MSLELNKEVLTKYNLTLSQYLLLWAFSKSTNLKADISILVEKGYIKETSDNNYSLVNSTKLILENIYLESAKKEKQNDIDYNKLAVALKDVYPKGKKPGTNVMWRGNTVEIVKKLKTIRTIYKFKFTFEQAINATKKYVDSFNGDYTNMRVLKYFLLKNVPEVDNEGKNSMIPVSDFMSLIENEDQEDISNTSWMDNVR